MAACKVEIHVSIVEVDLDASLVAKHLAYSASLSVGTDFAIDELDVLLLCVSDDKHLPHMRIIEFLKVVRFHESIQSLNKLLTLL